MSLHLGIRGPGHLSRAPRRSAPPPPVPGSQPTTINAADIPVGAIVYQYHPHTATLVTAPRTDGATGLTSMRRVQGDTVGILAGAVGSNQQPRVETDPRGIKRLVLEGAQWAEMLDATSFSTRSCAVFVVMKPLVVNQFNSILHVGIVGASPPVNNEVLMVYADPAPDNVRQRMPRVGARYMADGNDATYSVNKDRIIVGEQMQVLWACSRNTTDPVMATGGARFVRGGVNETGVNGVTSAAASGVANGFTFGRSSTSGQHLNAHVWEVVVVNFVAGTQMTFAQAQNISAALMANHGVSPIDKAILSTGDSRIAQNTLGGAYPAYRIGPNATYPDGALPPNVRFCTMGAGGSTLQQAIDWRDGTVTNPGTALMMSAYQLQGAGMKNILGMFWLHNDIGAAGNTLYAPTAASTTARCDAILQKFVDVIGVDTPCFGDMFDEVWVWNPLASSITGGATLFPYVRNTAPQAFLSAAFITACRNGVPGRTIRVFDMVGYVAPRVNLVNKTTLAFIQTDTNVSLFNVECAANDPRTANTTGTSAYYPYIYDDRTHPGFGGSAIIGRQFGAWAASVV